MKDDLVHNDTNNKKSEDFLQRLQARDAQRRAAAAIHHETSQEAESAKTFLDQFTQQRLDLHQRIQNLDTHNNKDENNNDLSQKLEDLEYNLAAAAYYLTPYDLRQATTSLATLRTQFENTSLEARPLKKFSFATKKKKERTLESDEKNSNIQPTSLNHEDEDIATAKGIQQDSLVSKDRHQEQQNDPPTSFHNTTALPSSHRAPLYLKNTNSTLLQDLSNTTLVILSTHDQSSTSLPPLNADPSNGSTIVYVNGDGHQDITIKNIKNCTIVIEVPCTALFLHGVTCCTLVTVGVVTGAIHAEELSDSTLYLASHQVRIHTAARCDFYLFVHSAPIIEHSNALRFAPYLLKLKDSINVLLQKERENEWNNVQDFGWLRSTPSPHWTILTEEERRKPPLLPFCAS